MICFKKQSVLCKDRPRGRMPRQGEYFTWRFPGKILMLLLMLFSSAFPAQADQIAVNPNPAAATSNQPAVASAPARASSSPLESPPVGNPKMPSSDVQGNVHSGFLPRQLQFGDLKAGIFWGDGKMSVSRDIAQGAASDPWIGTVFPGFNHRSDTSLDDTFVAVEWGFRWGDRLVGTTSFDTNIGQETEYKQTSIGTGRNNMGILSLPGDSGIITLHNENRILNLDQSFALRLMPSLQLLAGWKYSEINSSLSPYSTANPINGSRTLPGQVGWQNYWSNTIPSTTSFSMDQRFWWTGPFLGIRLTKGTPQKLPGQWHVEGKAAPYVWGNYKFRWNASYKDSFSFMNGQETTDMGLHGYFLEVKGGMQIKLAGNLFLDVWSKYSYLHMEGSGREVQSEQNNWTAVRAIAQASAQSISLKENFWGAGANLVWHF